MVNKKIFFLIWVIMFLGLEVAAEDITSLYSLPAIKRVKNDSEVEEIIKSAKVLKYAQEMPVRFTDVVDTDRFVNNLKVSIKEQLNSVGQNYKKLYFNGRTSKELNSFIKSLPVTGKIEIILTKREIILDEAVNLRSNTIIRGSSTRLAAGKTGIAIIGNGVENTGLRDLTIDGPGKAGIMLINTSVSVVDNITILNSQDRGMVIRGQSRFIHVNDSRFIGNRRGGIMIQDGSHHVYISHSEVSGGSNSSNWSAGIVITSLPSVSEYGIRDAFENNYFHARAFPFNRETVPFKNLIEGSYIHDNQSSGIYLDGGNGNVIAGNYIINNDKEGLCLDYFSVYNIVESNSIKDNGFRRFQTDNDLRNDEVLSFGRLANGSAASKLPNISLDNAAYNIIIKNTITGAAGDGVKIVRSGFRNIIGLNSITDNNAEDNSVFLFSGVLLGSALVEDNISRIDALPSIENIVFGNTIYGHHRFGVLIDPGSVYNDVYDNVIMKQKAVHVFEHDRPNSVIGNNFNMAESFWGWILISKKRMGIFFAVLITVLFIFSGATGIFFAKRYLNNRKDNTT